MQQRVDTVTAVPDPHCGFAWDVEPQDHQAVGMLVVQLTTTTAIAALHLRAYGAVHQVDLVDVAAAVLAHRLRLDGEPPGAHER